MSTADVPNTLKVIADIQKAILDGGALIKGGPLSYFKIGKIFGVIHDIEAIIAAAPAALPELKTLNEADVAPLTQAAYALVQAVIAEFTGAPIPAAAPVAAPVVAAAPAS